MSSQTPLETLVLTLHDVGAIQIGRFRLHSGKESRIYIDLRVVVSYPDALRQVADAYVPLLDGLHCDLLVATPLAGLPIGTAITLRTDLPLIYPRKTSKSYGTGKDIEGSWEVGQTAVVIDDLVTSGDSIMQTIAVVKAAGLKVKDAVVLIDRQQGGPETLAKQGYKLHSAIGITDVLDILVANDHLSPSKRDKVLASLDL